MKTKYYFIIVAVFMLLSNARGKAQDISSMRKEYLQISEECSLLHIGQWAEKKNEYLAPLQHLLQQYNLAIREYGKKGKEFQNITYDLKSERRKIRDRIAILRKDEILEEPRTREILMRLRAIVENKDNQYSEDERGQVVSELKRDYINTLFNEAIHSPNREAAMDSVTDIFLALKQVRLFPNKIYRPKKVDIKQNNQEK